MWGWTSIGEGLEIFICQNTLGGETKEEAPERSLELSRASPYYIDVLKSEDSNSSGGEPFMGRTLGPLDGPWLALMRTNKQTVSALSRSSGVLPIGVLGWVSSACDFSRTVVIL